MVILICQGEWIINRMHVLIWELGGIQYYLYVLCCLFLNFCQKLQMMDVYVCMWCATKKSTLKLKKSKILSYQKLVSLYHVTYRVILLECNWMSENHLHFQHSMWNIQRNNISILKIFAPLQYITAYK